jgi:DnaJ homolog subfamily C member 2
MTSVLPVLDATWTGEEGFKNFSAISTTVKRQVEPVGPGFLAHARRTLRGRTWSEDEKIQAEQNVKKIEEEDDGGLEDEPEDPAMLTRDPKDWKGQDHYAVLGLSSLRYKATEEQIRIGHRRKVLKHHPDKKAAEGAINEDGFFKCIQKAFEILLDPVKRAQWDSVDEGADVPPPSKKAKVDFIKVWTRVFDSEARFSRNKPVPGLGTMESSKAEVDAFYSFWYNFDSWRSFEYLDEDVPDDTSNRDNKRYIERKNNAARKKHKTEDTARLRKLVDDALAADPRIKLFKEAEQKAKEQRKWEREAGAREAAEAAKKAKEEAERKQKEEEEAAKSAKEASKKSKESIKNAKKKNKRTIRSSVKDVNYFSGSGEPDAQQIDNILNDVDAIVDKLDDLGLETVAGKLSGVTDADKVKSVFSEQASSLGLSGLKYFS